MQEKEEDLDEEFDEEWDYFLGKKAQELNMWANVTAVFLIVWSPIFVFGMFSLFNLIGSVTNFFVEHWLSNLMLPAYLLADFLIFHFSVRTGWSKNWTLFGGFLSGSTFFWLLQVKFGTNAMYFLKYNSKENDKKLWPSLLYLLKWISHTPRTYDASLF